MKLEDLEIQAQPDDLTCGPTCLHAVYRYFGDDVSIVPREKPPDLAAAIEAALDRRLRTTDATRQRLVREFSLQACASSYWRVYRSTVSRQD